MNLVFVLLDQGFCMCVVLFKMASHYLPNTMVWASVAVICSKNPFSEKMLGTFLWLRGLFV